MKKITLSYLLLLISFFAFSQEYTYIDFGSNAAGNPTGGNWNNVVTTVDEEAGITIPDMVDSMGANTGVTLTVDDPFHAANISGTTTPSGTIPFPSTSTRDSFFGETSTFSGVLQPTGGFILTGLDPTKYYSFTIFASRIGVSDNREAQYTLVGSSTEVVYLNSSNNTANVVQVFNLQSNGSGEITLTAEPGPNNDNSFGFYYLGAIEMIKTDTTLSSDISKLEEMLNIYPNPVSDVFELKLNLIDSSNIKIEIFDLNGRLVSSLFEGQQPAGNFSYTWERRTSNSNLSSGSYFLKVSVNDKSQTTKLILN